MGAVVAEYSGICPQCELSIRPGHLIVAIDDEWVHADCWLPKGDRRGEVCPTCFLERPCEHDDERAS